MIGNIDNKIVVSNDVSFGKKYFKYFIGYQDANKIRRLCVFLQIMNTYRRDRTKFLSFLVKDEIFLEKYNGKKSATGF